MCTDLVMLSKLTWILLVLFKSFVNVDQGEVVSLWVLELHVVLCCFWLLVHRGNQETSWC